MTKLITIGTAVVTRCSDALLAWLTGSPPEGCESSPWLPGEAF